jgi:hypothetical protein
MQGQPGKWGIVFCGDRCPKRHTKRRSAARTRSVLWLGATVALLPLAVACGPDDGDPTGDQPDQAIISKARSSFCKTFAAMNVYGGPGSEELKRYAASLSKSAEDLERLGDTEFAEAARRLASGMEAAQDIRELRAFLDDEVRPPGVSELKRSIGRMTGVSEIEFISKEEAYEEFKRLYGNDPEFSEEISAYSRVRCPQAFE